MNAAMILLNVVFAVFVTIGMLSILSWGIVRNKRMSASLSDRAHARHGTPRGAAGRSMARGYGRITASS